MPHLEIEVLHVILPQADIQGQQLALKEMENIGVIPPQKDNGSICELSGSPAMCSMPCSRQNTLMSAVAFFAFNKASLCSDGQRGHIHEAKTE